MEAYRILDIKGREILDCRGFPTLQVDLILTDTIGRADVPVGKSTGKYEAVEVRDGGKRFAGQGVKKALKNIEEIIAPALRGMDVRNQREMDFLLIALDGTQDKSKLGSNTLFGVSLANARAASQVLQQPLYKYLDNNAHIIPVPMVNLINGGKHASNDLAFQEFIIAPLGARSFMEALQIATEVNLALKEILVNRFGKMAVNVGDEGGFAPPISNVFEAMSYLEEAVHAAGYEEKVVYGLDVAASHFYDTRKKRYIFDHKELTAHEMIDFYQELVRRFPIKTIEDPLYEDDLEGTAILTRKLGIQIVGDDLFTTNGKRLGMGIEMGSANALLWKVNQIGTLSEALDVAQLAFRNGYGVMVSERSGETEDPIIADLVVGLNAGQIKTGAPVRSERTAKYNRLLQIEEELGELAFYAGEKFRQPF